MKSFNENLQFVDKEETKLQVNRKRERETFPNLIKAKTGNQ